MTDPAATLLVHATNVTGLGASHAVNSLLGPLCDRLENGAHIYVPDRGPAASFSSGNERIKVVRHRRAAPRTVSRMAECIFPSLYFPETPQTLVLGDIPLRGRRNQVVLVHQPHLVKPHVNPFVSSAPIFRVSRWLFARHLPFVKRIVAQTAPMRDQLEQSYPTLKGRIEMLAQPAPAWLRKADKKSREQLTGSFSLFYPAAGYLHKNHELLRRMDAERQRQDEDDIRITVTLTATEAQPVRGVRWIVNVGRLDPEGCVQRYQETDGVFFPSVLESCPLPLVEAMTLGLPVVCADLPYARWVCEGEAIYFDPMSGKAAWRAIRELRTRITSGWRPDWTGALAKLPRDWDEVARSFIEILNGTD